MLILKAILIYLFQESGITAERKPYKKLLNKKTYHLELQINKSSKEQLKKESSFKTVSNLVLSRAVL